MTEIITALMLWVSQQTGFTIPPPPAIVYLSQAKIKRYAYGCDEDPIPHGNKNICDDNVEVAGMPQALYDHSIGTVIVSNTFTIDTVKNKSILLHEVIHHMQYTNSYNLEVVCQGQLEEQAYMLQDQWLRDNYNVNVYETIGLGPLVYHLITSCEMSY